MHKTDLIQPFVFLKKLLRLPFYSLYSFKRGSGVYIKINGDCEWDFTEFDQGMDKDLKINKRKIVYCYVA